MVLTNVHAPIQKGRKGRDAIYILPSTTPTPILNV